MLNIHLNGDVRSVPVGTNVAQLVATLALSGKRFAVERNGEIISKSCLETTLLADKDRVEIVIAVGGG